MNTFRLCAGSLISLMTASHGLAMDIPCRTEPPSPFLGKHRTRYASVYAADRDGGPEFAGPTAIGCRAGSFSLGGSAHHAWVQLEVGERIRRNSGFVRTTSTSTRVRSAPQEQRVDE